MIEHIFRPTTADFRNWCKRYVWLSFDIVIIYESSSLLVNRRDYEFARKIWMQYKVLLASLDKDTRTIFKNTIMSNKAIHYSDKEERIAFHIKFENWKEICFPERKYQLTPVTKEQIGEKIKTLRERKNFTRQYVADIIGISESTLKAYENGDRMLRFDVACLLAQVYQVSLDELK